MSRLHLGTAFVALGIVLVACSSNRPTTEKLGETTQDIQGGTTDTTHSFVVGISANLGNSVLTCSGALVLPNMVLTARHCVDDTNPQIDCTTSAFGARLGQASQYTVTTNYKIAGAPKATQHVVQQIITPTPTDVCGNDIAILILKDSIPATDAVPAIPNTGHSLIDQKYYNSNAGFTAIGYGITSPTGMDSGTRRIKKDIETSCIYGDCSIDCAKIPTSNLPANTLTPNEFLGGPGTCEGDSGSGAWMQNQFDSNVFVAMGVLSRGGSDTTTCAYSIYTRIDVWRDLIVQTAETASASWTKYPKPTPDWTVYTAPPACPSSGGPAKKDAGAPAAGSKAFGDACTADSQCTTKKCTSGICTQACTVGDATSCPSGFTCDATAGVCLAGGSADDGGAGNHATSTTTTSGCSMGPAPDPSKPVPWKTLGLGALGALGLVARRRRR